MTVTDKENQMAFEHLFNDNAEQSFEKAEVIEIEQPIVQLDDDTLEEERMRKILNSETVNTCDSVFI